MHTPTGSPGAQTSGSNLQRTTPRGNSGDTPSAKRNKPRTPEQRAAPHPGDVPENVLDELCDGAIRELDHFELGLPAGDEQIAKLLDDKRAELRRLIRTYPDVRRIVETAARAGKERVILVKPRVPVSGHDGSGIDVERVSFTPISAYVFYFVINSTSRLQLAIAESQSKLEKHSMEVHLENRIALGLFGERDGEVTYASYAGMTPSSGSKARGDAHRRGDSGASRLNAATTGALGNTKQTEKFAALDRALGHLALSAMVRALQKVFWKLVRYKSNVTLVEANKLVADFGPPYQPSSARGVGNRWHAALKDQLVPLDLDLKITGSAGGYQVNAYENALDQNHVLPDEVDDGPRGGEAETVRKMTRCWAEPRSSSASRRTTRRTSRPARRRSPSTSSSLTIGVRDSVPEWAMKTEVLGFNDDGTAEVTTQQLSGAMKADLAAFGPWPEVKLRGRARRSRRLRAVYPKETATIEFTYDGKKIKKAVWHSVEATEGANTTHVDPPSGFICLRLGAAQEDALFNPPIMAMHYLAKWAKKLGIKM
ncbi:hypothetical protein JL721_11925 [Aureococcus anophagefferens]|nr:hypothetical protein JL721_11925 [Aureococcus anophagefferens]